MKDSHPRTCTAALALVGGLLLSGCGGSSGTSEPTAGHTSSSTKPSVTPSASAAPTDHAAVTDACALVTEAEVTTALGVDPGRGTKTPRAGLSECQFGDTPKFVMVDLGHGEAKAEYDQKRASVVPGVSPVDLSGIGDAAFGAFKKPAAIIGFYRGNAFVAITIYDTNGSQGKTVTLAKAAAGRL